jgi:hypothetical protein
MNCLPRFTVGLLKALTPRISWTRKLYLPKRRQRSYGSGSMWLCPGRWTGWGDRFSTSSAAYKSCTRPKVDLFLHQQDIDTTTPGGKALFQMMGVFAELDVEDWPKPERRHDGCAANSEGSYGELRPL